MSKYSRNLKISIANEFLSGVSSEILSKKYSICSSQIRYWGQVVAIHSNDSFQPTSHLRDAQARLQALELMWANDWSLRYTSAMLNLVSPGILSAWLNRYREKGFVELAHQSRGRLSMKPSRIASTHCNDEKTVEELKEEITYLQAENAVLKKLEELRQTKRQQTKKKR
ncbi:helix-turn-helix domain-containing protein [Orbus sturtevantii]|uniref:helix-turn-helix domain-containing protein n=2 Tax=Orbus sturtevantii TaxID=3074109 RepID=UPI00370DB890